MFEVAETGVRPQPKMVRTSMLGRGSILHAFLKNNFYAGCPGHLQNPSEIQSAKYRSLLLDQQLQP